MEGRNLNDNLEDFYLNCGFSTKSLHAGEHTGQPQGSSHTGAIYQSSTFLFKNADEGADIFAGRKDGYMYTRLGNPSVRLLEAKINALEGGDFKKKNPQHTVSTLAFSSGMAAISTAILATVKQGDTVIMGDVVYGATEHLATHVLSRYGVNTIHIDTGDLKQVEEALSKHPKASCFFLETPTNPLLVVSDIEEICKMAHQTNPNMKVIVDNTFSTPYLQRPLELGADVVVHSTTKYICGHGTVVGGLATTYHEDVKNQLYMLLKDLGSNPGPFDAWLVNLGLKTLPVRMDVHCANTKKMAKFLLDHPKVGKVYYPGFEDSPYYQVARKQMKDFGGMISFELKDGLEAGKKLMDNIKVFSLAVSLGCVDSLIQHPASMTHACMSKDLREKGGITDGLVRASIGIEDCDDLLNAMEDALKLV